MSTPTPVAEAPAPVAAPSASRSAATALARFADSVANAPEWRSAHWGLLVVDPGRGETLYSRNADKLFVPASNQKLITGSTALAQLGPGYRWTTTLLARGPVRAGVLEGDLVARGDGDPSISAHVRGDALAPFRALADSLRARGVTRVRGRIAAAPSPFTDAPLGFGWAWDDLDEPYSAGVDALYFNEGFTEIVVRAGARAGDVARAATRPVTTFPSLIVRAVTVARPAAAADSATKRTALTVGFDSSRAGVLVAGTIVEGDSAVLELAFRDLRAAYLAALREGLRAGGITIDEARTDTTARLDSLVAMQSPSLREILPYFEKPSQNQIGELLYKTIALHATGVGRADSASQVIGRQLVAWGAVPDGFAVRDGSGLSRHDFVSPRTLVHVLDAMRRHPDFRVFYDALPVAGVDGTIGKRMRGTAAQGNVHAKTGFVDKARSLSGYVTTADGRLLLFSALCNNYSVPTSAVERVQDALAIRLATLRLAP
ncbi:MAG TPA: D-alanyl-D-alanine carboxypeptidase/D-alanyl-D-alanine-endopeptidase [Gemmatimonadaceae bacterium]|nr:D-alanyl-D-alanine carboxypeptidase/D-alanyl-D-alanine-endopeptidase [Gemmatimonadaceae bacterium]